MQISLTTQNQVKPFRSNSKQAAPKAIAAKNVPVDELFKQAEIEGDTPYSKSNVNIFTILGDLVGGPGAKSGPMMTKLERNLHGAGVSKKQTAGQVRKSLVTQMAKKIGKGVAKVGLGLLLGAGSVALFAAAAGPAGLGAAIGSIALGAPALVTIFLGAGQAVSDVGELKSLHSETGNLSETAAERLNSGLPKGEVEPQTSLFSFANKPMGLLAMV